MKHQLGFLVAAIWLLSAIPSMAQNAPSFRLSLDVGDSTFELGEPVHASLVLTNEGEDSVTVFQNLYPEVGVAGIEIGGASGEARIFVPLSIDDVDDQPEPLESGAFATAVFPIFYGANGWTFAAAGRYRLTAFYEHPSVGGGEKLVSETVTITIEPDPSGAAADLMQGEGARDEAALFLVWEGGDHLRKGISDLETLIESYPGSGAADHARLALGTSLSKSFRDYSIGKVREPDYARALGYLEAVDETRFKGYPGVQQSLSRARCLAGLDREEEARNAAAKALDLSGGQPALRERLDLSVSEEDVLKGMLPQR